MSEQLIKTPGPFGENGNFLLERELGAGGMGGVYMGRDKMLDRPVAVKVMLKELGADPEFVEKFKKEAQSAARLIHPNIAQIYSYGICDGMPYIAMELAAGGSLYSIMTANPGKTDVARVLKICQQVAQALQCASDQGCVHGDVKPENILLDANGNAKLVDFGLAAMQKDTSEIWGTPYYISPEKVKKEPIDFRADIYSLGGTLYHALTGVAPFEGENSVAVVKKRFEGMPKKPSEIRPELTSAIDGLVMKMLALNKEDRFPSFEALIETFRSVLTTGLTPSASPQEKKAAAAGGAKKPLAVRGRRMMMRRPGASTSSNKPASETSEDEGPIRKKKALKRPLDTEEDDEEEESGSLGLKVVGIVVGVILLIGGVLGGLVWYQVADKKARAAEEQAQITTGINTARGAIRDTVTTAEKFADEFDEFANKAIEACQKPTDELKKILPPEQGELLKPGPSQELLDAIASTNEPVAVAEGGATNAVPADAGSTNAVAVAVVTNAAPAVMALPQFRPPTEDEMDPSSPEGEAYLKARRAFEDEQLKKLRERKKGKGKDSSEDKAESEKPAEEKSETQAEGKEGGETSSPAAEEKKQDQTSQQAVMAMNELWERAYGCQASAVRLRHAVRQVLKKAAEAEEIKDSTREAMDKLGELSKVLVEQFEQVKSSKDVENVRKGITFIKSKGEKTVAQTVRRLRIEKLEAERKAKKEAADAAERERLAKIEADKKALIEKETAEIKAKFDAVVTQGCFRQLDWKSALRQLETLRADFKTTEGQLAADLQIRKVNDMKMVHELFIKGLPNYVFRSNKLKNVKVTEVDEKEIRLVKADGKTKQKIAWQKFYKDYPGNLNEIMNLFVINTRQPTSKYKLNLRDWADAMTGAALTMQLVCSEVNGAITKAEMLAKETVKAYPEYQKTAQEIFPNIQFEATATEE